MCGVTGLLRFSSHLQSQLDVVEAMNSALAHRGPDDHGVWSEGAIALGHRRLAIIDLSPGGHQPMRSYDERFVLVFNGEIYNYRELKAELGDYPFRSASDSEVILAAYEKWGTACLPKLAGMFVFAIWDRQAQTLLIARDRLGKKPLYWYRDESNLVFASEIRSVLASGLAPRKLSASALSDYFFYQTVHAPNTAIEGVRMLQAGHYLLAKTNGEISEHKFWDFPTHCQPTAFTAADWAEQVREKLRQAVSKRLVSDVPFGAFLSGGIDSSAIVALMSKAEQSPVKTFCITFDEKAFNEAHFAHLIAKKYHTEHHEIRLSPTDFLKELPLALKAMDHVSGDGPNTYVVSKATRQAGITMALSGLGGDELFGGYPIFQRSLRLQKMAWLTQLPRPLRNMMARVVQWSKDSIQSRKIGEALQQERLDPLDLYYLSRQAFSAEQVHKMAPGLNAYASPVRAWSAQIKNMFGDLPLLSQVSIAEMRTYMENTLLRDTDQMSMANALEVRTPFLDHELIELVLQVPDAVKMPSFKTPKPLLVAAMGDLLPPAIVNRPKMGFTLPFAPWMRKEMRAFCEERLHSLGKRDYFIGQEINAVWQQFLEGHPGWHWSRLWALVVLEEWLSENNIH
jgi:asparagine synthase (glutamine-hydrolysing)